MHLRLSRLRGASSSQRGRPWDRTLRCPSCSQRQGRGHCARRACRGRRRREWCLQLGRSNGAGALSTAACRLRRGHRRRRHRRGHGIAGSGHGTAAPRRSLPLPRHLARGLRAVPCLRHPPRRLVLRSLRRRRMPMPLPALSRRGPPTDTATTGSGAQPQRGERHEMLRLRRPTPSRGQGGRPSDGQCRIPQSDEVRRRLPGPISRKAHRGLHLQRGGPPGPQ